MKDSGKFETRSSLVERHCVQLEVVISRLHEKVSTGNKEEARQRQKALWTAERHPGQAFHQDDYVMVAAANNQVNPTRTHKVKVHWQGPYEIVGASGPTSYMVRLLGDTEDHEVHWKNYVG